MREKITNLIVELCRSLYSDPSLNPAILIDGEIEKGFLEIKVNVSPYNPALLIGQRGSMKFATQLLIAYGAGLPKEGAVELFFTSSKEKDVERTSSKPADTEKLKNVSNAIAEMIGGSTRLEASDSAVMVFFEVPARLEYGIKPPLAKIIRSCGKAAGFAASPHVVTIK